MSTLKPPMKKLFFSSSKAMASPRDLVLDDEIELDVVPIPNSPRLAPPQQQQQQLEP